jgi:hypothetical protein
MKTKIKNKGEIYAKTASSTYSEFQLNVTHTFSFSKYCIYTVNIFGFRENATS